MQQRSENIYLPYSSVPVSSIPVLELQILFFM